MLETPYAVLEPDTPYPQPEVGSTTTFSYEKERDGNPTLVEIRIEQILFDSESRAKVLGRTVESGCFVTVLYRHTRKETGRYNGRIVFSDDCSP